MPRALMRRVAQPVAVPGESGCAPIVLWQGCSIRVGLLSVGHATLLDMLCGRWSRSRTCPSPQAFTGGRKDSLAGLRELAEGQGVDAGAVGLYRTASQVAMAGYESWCSLLWRGVY